MFIEITQCPEGEDSDQQDCSYLTINTRGTGTGFYVQNALRIDRRSYETPIVDSLRALILNVDFETIEIPILQKYRLAMVEYELKKGGVNYTLAVHFIFNSSWFTYQRPLIGCTGYVDVETPWYLPYPELYPTWYYCSVKKNKTESFEIPETLIGAEVWMMQIFFESSSTYSIGGNTPYLDGFEDIKINHIELIS